MATLLRSTPRRYKTRRKANASMLVKGYCEATVRGSGQHDTSAGCTMDVQHHTGFTRSAKAIHHSLARRVPRTADACVNRALLSDPCCPVPHPIPRRPARRAKLTGESPNFSPPASTAHSSTSGYGHLRLRRNPCISSSFLKNTWQRCQIGHMQCCHQSSRWLHTS